MTDRHTIQATMARDACAGMTEAERVSLAIELVNGVDLPASAAHLRRLARLAKHTAIALERVAAQPAGAA